MTAGVPPRSCGAICLRQYVCARTGGLLRPLEGRVGGAAGVGEVQSGLGRGIGVRRRGAARPRTARRSLRAMPSLRERHRWRRPMLATSSAVFRPSWATDAPSSWAKCSTGADNAATFSSKAQARRPLHAAVTDGQRSGRSCANICSVRPCTRWVSQRHARWPPCARASPSIARWRCRARC